MTYGEGKMAVGWARHGDGGMQWSGAAELENNSQAMIWGSGSRQETGPHDSEVRNWERTCVL
jgi:hypothetical protein